MEAMVTLGVLIQMPKLQTDLKFKAQALKIEENLK
jgi:hypothetical protein